MVPTKVRRLPVLDAHVARLKMIATVVAAATGWLVFLLARLLLFSFGLIFLIDVGACLFNNGCVDSDGNVPAAWVRYGSIPFSLPLLAPFGLVERLPRSTWIKRTIAYIALSTLQAMYMFRVREYNQGYVDSAWHGDDLAILVILYTTPALYVAARLFFRPTVVRILHTLGRRDWRAYLRRSLRTFMSER